MKQGDYMTAASNAGELYGVVETNLKLAALPGPAELRLVKLGQEARTLGLADDLGHLGKVSPVARAAPDAAPAIRAASEGGVARVESVPAKAADTVRDTTVRSEQSVAKVQTVKAERSLPAPARAEAAVSKANEAARASTRSATPRAGAQIVQGLGDLRAMEKLELNFPIGRLESLKAAESAAVGGAPKLLPTEGNVGTYRDLINAGAPGDNVTPHHIPSRARMELEGVSNADGIAINMEQPRVGGRHRATFTYGAQADIAMTPRGALAAGVLDARQIYRADGLYTPQIRSSLQELIQMNKAQYPTTFRKPGQ